MLRGRREMPGLHGIAKHAPKTEDILAALPGYQRRSLMDSPVAVGAAAFGAGVLLGAILGRVLAANGGRLRQHMPHTHPQSAAGRSEERPLGAV